MSFSQISLIKFLFSEENKKCTCCRDQLPRSVLCCAGMLQTTSGCCGRAEPLKLSQKGRCGIAQASNIGCKSVSITPEDKHALLACLGVCSHVYFPWKAGAITKAIFVSFNKVMCSLELAVEHCLACVPLRSPCLGAFSRCC